MTDLQSLYTDAARLVALCRDRGITLATAESCTGGMIGATLTAVPGASSVFLGGVISYANEIKEALLQVPSKTITTLGAVSHETAEAMAKGAVRGLNADFAVSATGIAGPDGGSEEKPVGLVYVAVSNGHTTQVTKNIFKGDRHEVRLATVAKAISLFTEAVESF